MANRSEYEDLSMWYLNEKEIDHYLDWIEKKHKELLVIEPNDITKEIEEYYIAVQTKLYFNIKSNGERFERYMKCIRLRRSDHIALKCFSDKFDQYASLFIRATKEVDDLDTALLFRFKDLYWFYTFRKSFSDTPRILWLYIKSRVFFLNHMEEYIAFCSGIDEIRSHKILIKDYQNKAYLDGISFDITNQLIDYYKEFISLKYFDTLSRPIFKETAEYKLCIRNGIVSYFRDHLPLVPLEWIEKYYAPDHESADSIYAEKDGNKPTKYDKSLWTK